MLDPNLPRRRVVITGMDALSCLGSDLDEIATSLHDQRSGIVVDEERTRIGFRSPLTGKLRPFDADAHFARRDRKPMGETALYACICAKRAVERSGCRDLLDSERAGVLIGNDSSAEPLPAVLDIVRTERSTGTIGSSKVIHALNSTATINLGPLFKTKGISLSVSGACASGSHAIGLAWMLISLGLQDTILAGGSQELCWWSMAAFDSLRVFSLRTSDPAAASRPFDRDRDGLIPSGGAAVLVLEEYAQAKARGAPILAEIEGYAFSSDGWHMTAADGKGAERCIRSALATAHLLPGDIDYINAHATATPAGDAAEALAIHAVFGGNCPPVSSTKSLTGHECWMAGASEALYSILMMQRNFIAGNRNYENPDPAMAPINVAARTVDNVRLRHVLSNSFGFGGTNACLILGRPPA